MKEPFFFSNSVFPLMNPYLNILKEKKKKKEKAIPLSDGWQQATKTPWNISCTLLLTIN